MNPQSSPWAPVVAAGIVALGAFLGNLLSLIGVWFVQAKTSQREREAKVREAKEKRANRWDELQIKTLIDLQDTLKHLVTLPPKKVLAKDLKINHGDVKSAFREFRQTFNDLTDASLHALVLSARVPDEKLTELVSKLVGMARTASHVPSMDEYKPFRKSLADTFDAANRRIGELLIALRPDHP